MCDASYLCQVEALERASLAQVALLPHMEEKARKDFPSVEQVRAEFDTWLTSEPERALSGPDAEQMLMYQFLGVAGKR